MASLSLFFKDLKKKLWNNEDEQLGTLLEKSEVVFQEVLTSIISYLRDIDYKLKSEVGAHASHHAPNELFSAELVVARESEYELLATEKV